MEASEPNWVNTNYVFYGINMELLQCYLESVSKMIQFLSEIIKLNDEPGVSW